MRRGPDIPSDPLGALEKPCASLAHGRHPQRLLEVLAKHLAVQSARQEAVIVLLVRLVGQRVGEDRHVHAILDVIEGLRGALVLGLDLRRHPALDELLVRDLQQLNGTLGKPVDV